MKVKLPKAVCEAIDNNINEMGAESIYNHLRNWGAEETSTPDLYTIYTFYKSYPFKLVTALVNGYEPIEEDINVRITPKQQKEIFDLHSRFVKTVSSHDLYRGLIVGEVIEDVLTIMNIQIEGVNK
jgi:hypothetical protein